MFYSVTKYSSHCADCLASHSWCQITMSCSTVPPSVHGLPSTAAYVLHSLPCCRLIFGEGWWTADCCWKWACCCCKLGVTTWSTLAALLAYLVVVTLHVFVCWTLLVTKLGILCGVRSLGCVLMFLMNLVDFGYLHTLLTCMVSGHFTAYALKWSTLCLIISQ